jgi:membrane protease YdiL (CAAX protease family)
MALQTIVLQALVFGLAWLASAGTGITVSWQSRLGTLPLLATIALLALFTGVAWAEARRPLGARDVLRRKLRRASPADPVWLTLTLIAGIVEEYAYRGVLTAILAVPFGTIAASVASAVLFGLAHSTQGWRGFAFSAAFGLALQGLVFVSGGLALAIFVHVAYDVGATWLGRRLADPQAGGASA